MEQLKKKRLIVQKTIIALKKSIDFFEHVNSDDEAYEFVRESVIQRFEYTIDTFWKFVKLYMQDYQKLTVDIASPRGVLRAAVEAKLITHTELNQLLDATTDRNLSSHAYDEDVAKQVIRRIPDHYIIIKTVFERMTIVK